MTIIDELRAIIARYEGAAVRSVGDIFQNPAPPVNPGPPPVAVITRPMIVAPSSAAAASVVSPLTLPILQKLWPHGDQHVPGLIEGMVAAGPVVFPKYGLNTKLVIAHAMAQFSEECGAGLEMVENMNYSAQRLLQVFPTHFTESMAERWAYNAKMIADIAYGGRMGNAPPPSDDGYNYRGRGLSQCTGKEGYQKLAAKTGIDVINNPGLLSDPHTALECGVADFVLCGCLPFAEMDDVIGVTKKLNGGLNGLSIRQQWLGKWKAALLP